MRKIITMPAYKAGRTIERTYREIPKDCYDAVLVVDDASPDDTVAIAEGLGLPTGRSRKVPTSWCSFTLTTNTRPNACPRS